MPPTKRLKLRKVRYWKINVGDDQAQWAAWLAGNFVALGWDELGDLSSLSRREFVERRDAVLRRFPERSKQSAAQVWVFARHIQEGDRIVVSRSGNAVLGIGTVAGAYFFIPDVYKGHCLPVEWHDLTPRTVDLPRWRRTLVELDAAQYEAIQQSEPLPAAAILAEAPVLYHAAAEAAVAERLLDVAAPDVEPLDLAAFAAAVGYDEATVARWVAATERKGQLIFYGPPGVGKTYVARALARHLASDGDGFYTLVQFHPAYTYEDFIQGIRPRVAGGGALEFRLEPGRFLQFCRQAALRQGRCVLIIDEINRANVASVFGELLYLLEYRDQSLTLSGGGPPFSIPANVRIIGAMNSADRSIALVDHALRRRFAFVELHPNYSFLQDFLSQKPANFQVAAFIEQLQRLNQQIGDRHYAVGISFFLRDDLSTTLPDIWQMEIEPYLEEYFFDQPARVEEFRWPVVARAIQWRV
jgi:hypothetical protein